MILIERGPAVLNTLTENDVAFLKKKHSKHLEFYKNTIKAGKNYAGLIECPSGQKIFIKPKVSIANLLYIIAYTHDLVDLYNYKDLKGITKVKTPIGIYVLVLLNWVGLLLKKGLIKSYKQSFEEGTILQGKLLLHSSSRITGKIRYEVQENSFSSIENQILKATLLHILKRIDDSEYTNLKGTIKSYLLLFDRVEDIKLTKKVFSSIKYTRLNQHYKRVIELCNLIYSNTFLYDGDGPVNFSGYIVSMEKVFERFILKMFKKSFGTVNVQGQYKVKNHTYTDEKSGKVKDVYNMVDIFVPKNFVAEVKYYGKSGEDKIPNQSDHINQTMRYAEILNINGLLIYPGNKVDFNPIKITNGQKKFRHIKIAAARFPINSEIDEFDSNIALFMSKINSFFA